MADVFKIHPETPQKRLLQRTAECLRAGGLIVYPTDSSYALGCGLGEKEALERIRAIRHFDKDHLFTLLCRDLSEISLYAKVDNWAFRMLKNATPGPYTFVLRATHEVPRRLQHAKRKTIGLRVPDHRIALGIVEALGTPIMTATLRSPVDDAPVSSAEAAREYFDKLVDVIVDGGPCGVEPTTLIDLSEEAPKVLREGKGALEAIGVV